MQVTRFKILLMLWTCCGNLSDALLYPASSTMAMIASVSQPVVEYFPERRILIDWCFTMTYALPSALSQFYNSPIWPLTKGKRSIYADTSEHNQTARARQSDGKSKTVRHENDFSAGELYEGLENLLVEYGFDDTCLLRSVCELAQHPFDERHENILTDVITFFLTPSIHEAFDPNETLYKEVYEEAELKGFLGENCTLMFPDCRKDFINIITQVLFVPSF